jgi:hypothetical protein
MKIFEMEKLVGANARFQTTAGEVTAVICRCWREEITDDIESAINLTEFTLRVDGGQHIKLWGSYLSNIDSAWYREEFDLAQEC